MNVKKILEKGYFPKELPPPFETIQFAGKSQYIRKKWENILNREKIPKRGESNNQAKKRFSEDYVFKYGSSKCLTFSLTKGIYSRRKIEIPNPKQFHDLSKIVVDNWKTIRNTYNLSEFSASTPIEKDAKRAVRTKSKTLNNFKFQLIELSFNKRYELRLDISNFYPSIYTHSISWAIMGKKLSKKYFKKKNSPRINWTNLLTTDANAQTYSICEKLDMLVRNCQERQSIGLPIGTDISFILAEIIGNRLDYEINQRLKDVDFKGTRYYDDYYFYTNTFNDTEKILKTTQQVLNDFQLETNESKVHIKEIPFSFESKWASELSTYRFKSINKYEIRNFFSVLFRLVEDNPKDSSWIFLYALGRFEYGNIKISKENWDLFLNLLIKTVVIDTSNIDQFLKILLSYKTYLTKKSKEKIKEVLVQKIIEHLSLNHSFEVSWALWILKSFNIKIDIEIILSVLKSDDYTSKLICLDIIHSRTFVGKKPNLSFLKNDLSANDLFNEKWLFTYESIKQGWLNPTKKVIEKHEYFKLLFNYNVSFYNIENQIDTTFAIPTHPETEPIETEPRTIDFEDFMKDLKDEISTDDSTDIKKDKIKISIKDRY